MLSLTQGPLDRDTLTQAKCMRCCGDLLLIEPVGSNASSGDRNSTPILQARTCASSDAGSIHGTSRAVHQGVADGQKIKIKFDTGMDQNSEKAEQESADNVSTCASSDAGSIQGTPQIEHEMEEEEQEIKVKLVTSTHQDAEKAGEQTAEFESKHEDEGADTDEEESDAEEECIHAETMFEGDDGEVHVLRARQVLVSAIADILEHWASLGRNEQRVTRFHAVRAPGLSVHDYLKRLATYYQCSSACLVTGLVYIDRVAKRHREFTISPLNVHRLLATSIMVAAKFWDDAYYSTAYYSKVAGVRVREMRMLEAQFLSLNGWRLHVSPREYDLYHRQVLLAAHGGAELALQDCGAATASGVSVIPSS